MSAKYISEALQIYDDNKGSPDVTKMILDHAERSYPKLSTRASSLGKFKRQLINKYFADGNVPDSVQRMMLSKEQYTDINKQQAKSLEKRANSTTTITNATDFISNVLSGLTSDEPGRLIPALLLATGRRSAEVLNTIELNGIDDRYAAEFTGQLKKRPGESHMYKIPLLAPYPVVQQALTKLKNILSNPKSPWRHQSTINRAVAAATKPYDLSAHKLRSIFAMANFHIHKPKATENAYIASILGHDGLSTSTHYNHFRLEGVPKGWRWKPAIDTSDFEAKGLGERTAVEKIVNMIKEGKKISVNELRRAGTSYLVAKRVLEKNRDVIENISR